ncbi:MAG: aminotransferase [Rhodothermales bacterium]|jgi:aminotransferase
MLQSFPPMGVYETLFKFADATSKYMGDPGTHPWAQGYPLTVTVPGGPDLPSSVSFDYSDLKYPKATGEIELRTAISDYYNEFYNAGINPDNVAVFAGGRPGILATLAFLQKDMPVLIEETEYTPYYDILKILGRETHYIDSNPQNRFQPGCEEYENVLRSTGGKGFLIRSNPCNPTGVTTQGGDLKTIIERFSEPGRGALFDEAYEFFCDPAPQSALALIDDIEATDIFVVGAATKGLQVPGMRCGWVIAAERHIEIFRNYSSWGMGGVSRASQLYVTELLEMDRVRQARQAICEFYGSQRERYGRALTDLGLELFTGSGGFYHWGRLPDGLTADEFNLRLFKHEAAILPGRLCDMRREEGQPSRLDGFIRFSFGPLTADSFESDIKILTACLV